MHSSLFCNIWPGELHLLQVAAYIEYFSFQIPVTVTFLQAHDIFIIISRQSKLLRKKCHIRYYTMGHFHLFKNIHKYMYTIYACNIHCNGTVFRSMRRITYCRARTHATFCCCGMLTPLARLEAYRMLFFSILTVS